MCTMGGVKPISISAVDLRSSGRGSTQRLNRAPRGVASATQKGRVMCAGNLSEGESAAVRAVKKVAGVAGAATLALALGAASPAFASDTAAVGKCLLQGCQKELAGCLTDEKCLESLVCLNKCELTNDVSSCQIKCGDLYGSKAISTFNTCAVTNKKCVAQIPDQGTIIVPKTEFLVQEFKTSDFDGKWYISNGLNKLFDSFDCQVHYFNAPEPDKLYAKLNWRINKTDGQFYERQDVQTFVQDPETPAILYNHDNEFLHYTDDWYIVSTKPDNYIFVYYRGSNDAWDGYGGAVVYSRTPNLDPEVIPEIREAAARLNLDFDAFTENDNTCAPAPPLRLVKPTDLDTLFDDVLAVETGIVKEVATEVKEVQEEIKAGERAIVKELFAELKSLDTALEEDIVSFGRGFTVFKDQLLNTKVATPEEAQAYKEKAVEQQKAEKLLSGVEKNQGNFIFSFFSNLLNRK